MAQKQSKENLKDMDFESALNALQAVVTRMENEQQSLDISIADYEKGSALAKICQKHLDEAQLKVEKLVKTKAGYRFDALDTENLGSDNNG